MIIDLFLNVVYAFILAITSPFLLLDDVTLPASWIASVTTAGGYAISLNTIIPVTTLLIVVGVFLAYESIYFGMKLINWVIRKIPTIS